METSVWMGVVSGLVVALLGGTFLAFSDFLMRSFAKTRPAGAIEAMQVLNREIMRSIFMVFFLGMGPLSILWMFFAWARGMGWLLAGGAVYLVGVFAVTVVCNVPMNRRLDALLPDSEQAQRYWKDTYLPRWTRWNTVRTVACLVSSLCFLRAAL